MLGIKPSVLLGEAHPSVRMVNVMAIETAGLLFFANRESGKGQQLRQKPHASLCFYWPQLSEQVIFEGAVIQVDIATSDLHWNNMSRERKAYIWLAAELPPSETRGQLSESVERDWELSNYSQIKRPEHWYAWRIVPERIEFWPSGWRRAQERELYTRDGDGAWRIELVNP